METSVLITPNKYQGHTSRTWIAIHTMEAPEAERTAENVASYFENPEVQASAHWCVDDNSRVRVVRDDDSAWTLANPDVNRISLNIELAGYAAQSADQWDDNFSDEELKNAAQCAAEWCHKYDIPVRHLSHDQIRGMHDKGFVGHVDVNAVFDYSSHTDPGPHFPWDRFLNMVREHLAAIEDKARPPHDVNRPECRPLQNAVRTTADNIWGANTEKHCAALVGATTFGGHDFPYGVKFAQQVVGAEQDGHWGPKSKEALHHTVTNVQKALAEMGFNPGKIDGTWGPVSHAALNSARAACHI